MKTRVYVLCGPGGVGKTTVSAAMGIALATSGLRTAVLTIDPARRLADTLQIGKLGNKPTRVPLEGASLDAMMLNPSETFDDFVRTYAQSTSDAETLLNNRYYQFASQKMGGIQEYTAMLKLLSLCESGEYDAVVLDTPPARNALEFLQAPQRMAHLMEKSALRFFSQPREGFRAFAMGTEVLSRSLKLFLGEKMIDDISTFFAHFGIISEAMYQHSLRADSLLHQAQFLMISSTQQSVQECLVFQQQLQEAGYPFRGYILNRVPPPLPNPVLHPTPEQQQWIQWILENEQAAHNQYQQQRTQLTQDAQCWSIPEQQTAPNHLTALQALGQYLPSN